MTQTTSDERAGEQSGSLLSPAEEKFELWRKRFGAICAPIAFLLVYSLLGDSSLDPRGRTLSAILAAVGVLWVSEFLPLPITALLGAVLCVVLGVADTKKTLGYFADPIVFVFIGGFILARAMSVHKLDRRLALSFLSIPIIGGSPAGMLAGIGLITAIISMWVSNTATTAMMLPIGLGMLSAVRPTRDSSGNALINARQWPFATGVMLMIAYGASIGGIGTPIGSPPNLIGIGLIRKATNYEISFFQWMALCVPLLVVMGLVLFVMLYLLHRDSPSDKTPTASGKDMLRHVLHERSQLGKLSRGEINTMICFGVAVFLWVLPGIFALPGLITIKAPWNDAVTIASEIKKHLDEPIVALIAAVLLFALPINWKKGEFTLTWEEGSKIDWGTILLFGGGLALGTLMFETGVADALGKSFSRMLGVQSLWGLTLMSIVLAMMLSEATSNTASANMIIPVVIAISQAAHVSPLPPALGACLGASYGFMLPVSTPPNAIVYGSGLVPIGKMMRAGIIFDVLGVGIIWIGLRLLCPMLGLM